MRNFWTLLKMQLNVNFGISALRYRFRKEKDKIAQAVAIAFAVIIGVGSLVFLYTLLMNSIYVAARTALGRPEIVLVLAFVGLQVFLLVTGIFYVLGVFFYSRDMSALIPLPVKPWQVLGAKFGVVLAYEYLMALPVLLPPVVIYGIGQSAGILYWLKAVMVILVSPALPLLIASLLAIALMRFLNVGRRKDLLAILGGIVAVALIVGFNLLTQRMAGAAANPNAITRLLESQASLVTGLSSAFPPAAWATLALSRGGLSSLWYLLLYVAVSAALLALMLWLANLTYYRSAVRSEEIARKKPSARSAALSAGNAKGPVRAVFLKDMKMLIRTPAFAMNCLIGTFILPIILPLTLLQNRESSAGIATLIQNPANAIAATLGALGFMMFTAVINITAATALSREGKSFWMSRMIPVPPGRQVYAKFLLSMAVADAGIVLTAAMLMIFLKFSVYQAVIALVLGLLGAVPITIVNMLPDLMKPKLSWTNPYEAVKQNLNVLLSMLAGFLLLGLEAFLAILLATAGLANWAVYLMLAGVQVALSVAGLKALSAASRRYYRIEI